TMSLIKTGPRAKARSSCLYDQFAQLGSSLMTSSRILESTNTTSTLAAGERHDLVGGPTPLNAAAQTGERALLPSARVLEDHVAFGRQVEFHARTGLQAEMVAQALGDRH